MPMSRDFCGTEAFGEFDLESSNIDLCGPSTVDATLFGTRNAFGLALSAQLGFELGEDPEHVEKALPVAVGIPIMALFWLQ